MSSPLFYENGRLFLSYAYLRASGINKKRYEKWVSSKKALPVRIKEVVCIDYDEISKDAKQELKPKDVLIGLASATVLDAAVKEHATKMQAFKSKGFVKYRTHYKSQYKLSDVKVLEASQLHSVWEYVLEVKKASSELESLYLAFNEVYPDKYSSKHSFANAVKKALENGIEAMCVDKRIFTTPTNIRKVSADNKYWVRALVSLGKKSSNRKVWEQVKTMCQQSGKEAPSKSWVDKYRKKLLKGNIDIFESRHGASDANSKKLPYVSTHHAQYANDQWQMDGWTLPFWTSFYSEEKKKNIYFHRPVLVVVRDAYSKKIVGSACGRSEDTLLIMEALRKAIINTGFLPLEILTDNHAFNQTKEAEYLKTEMANLGAAFTVTSNPQYKAIVERYNQHLDALCSDYYGYLGKGLRSKSIDARPKPELLTEYAKNFLPEAEAKLIALAIVEKFNQMQNSKGISPNELYENSEKLHGIEVDLFQRIKLLTAQTELKITRGQLTIKRGSIKYEYQLPADLYMKYNDEVVAVRYEDLNDCIYLYDKHTGEEITVLSNKPKIFGAKVNQSERDKELLIKHSGRIKGIKAAARKENEQATLEALKENPDAIHLLNIATTPKNILKEIEQDAHLKRLANEEGLCVDVLSIPKRESQLQNKSLIPVSKLDNNKPFDITGKHQPSIINLNELDED